MCCNSPNTEARRERSPLNSAQARARVEKALRIAKKILGLTMLYATVLAVRSVIIVVDWLVPHENTSRGLAVTLVLRILFQALCELVPAAITLKVLGRPIAPGHHTQSDSAAV